MAAAAAWIWPHGAFGAALTITSSRFVFVDPGLTQTDVSPFDHTLSGTTSGGWNVSAEACVDGFCGGAGGPQSSATTPVVRLTNATFSCANVAGCGFINLGFGGIGTGVLPGTLSATVAIDGSVTGIGQTSIVFNGWDFSNGPDALVGFTITQDGPFNLGPQTQSTTASAAGFSVNGTLHINDAHGPETLSFPGSFTVTVANTAAPEPTTMGLAGAAR